MREHEARQDTRPLVLVPDGNITRPLQGAEMLCVCGPALPYTLCTSSVQALGVGQPAGMEDLLATESLSRQVGMVANANVAVGCKGILDNVAHQVSVHTDTQRLGPS